MIIRKYGIELHRLTRDDIELVRVMRNRDDIRSRMFEQELITKEQQERWFESIDNMFNYYFIIQHEGRKVGLIHGKNSDFDRRENEGGIFIWEPSLLGTGIASKVSICFIECSFELLLMERIIARVRRDNSPAYNYNLSLGYVPDPVRGEPYLILTRDAFRKKAPYLRWLASGARNSAPLSIDDVEAPDVMRYRHLYEDLPADILEVLRPRLLAPHGWLEPR